MARLVSPVRFVFFLCPYPHHKGKIIFLFGFLELLLYLSEQKNLSYYGFLIRYRNIIVESLSSPDTWDDLNNIWTNHFLRESEIIFDEPTYNELKKKVRCLFYK